MLKDLTALRHGALTAIVLGVLVAGSNAMAACQSSNGEIEVRVDAVRSAAGSIVAVLYGDNPADFLKKGKRLDKVFEPAQEGLVSVCLTAPAPGMYAVAIYHDENGNENSTKPGSACPTRATASPIIQKYLCRRRPSTKPSSKCSTDPR